MTLWSAAGISVAAAAVSTSGGGTNETLQWLVGLCLSGPVAMEQQARPFSPSVAMGLGLISAALITGGLWPGRKAEPESVETDHDQMLAAMSYVASATGGITPAELSSQVTDATGMELSPEEAVLALQTYRGTPAPGELAWIGEGQNKTSRDAIMRAALKVAWTHGDFTPGGLEMIGHLAENLGYAGEDLALLFWEVSEPPAHADEDPLKRLRPNSRMLARDETPALA